MRIIHIMAGRNHGGAETYSGDVMLGLHKRGIDQCVVIHRHASRYQEIVDAGIRTAPEVLDIPFGPWRRFMLARLLRREKPDLVHCWMRRAASLMPRWDACPVIGWFGGYYDPRYFTRCDHIIGVTRDIVTHIMAHGVAADHAHYIPTFPAVRDATIEPPISRAALDTPNDALVVLALSRLHPKKGLDTLLHAIRDVPQAYLWLAGSGPIETQLRQLTAQLGLESRVRFLGWRTDRAALLRASDICALPSRYEPFGTVILEAWAAGTPLIACRSAGPASHVTDGENGLLVDIDNTSALTAAICRLQNDAALRQRLIINGTTTYHRDYTPEAVLDRIMGFYEGISSSFEGVSGEA